MKRIALYNAGKRPVRKIRGSRPSRQVELAVRKEIWETLRGMVQDVENISEWLSGTAAPEQALTVLSELQDKWREIYGSKSPGFASRWVGSLSENARRAQEKRLASALGVDYTAIFDDKIVANAASLMSTEASALIERIPEKYFADIEEKVLLNYQQLPLPNDMSLTEYIAHTYNLEWNQAKLLARDQTSKINSAITQARNEELGVKEYIWRTAGDSRVVGAPGGLWTRPNRVHGNHYERDGKVFRWDEPPFDGHPGYAINCRCVADPIIVIDELKNVEWGQVTV